MEILAAERNYKIEAEPNRVWDLLGRAIFDSLGQGLSKMKVIDENNFRAELKVRVFGIIPITMFLRGEMTDITPPDYLRVKLTTRSKWNLVTMVQTVSFTMKAADNDSTSISCRAMADGLNPLFGWALSGQVKSQANGIFETIEERLRQWT